MTRTTFAHQVAANAAGARPCDVSGDFRWHLVAGLEMPNAGMSQISTTKCTARRLGKRPT